MSKRFLTLAERHTLNETVKADYTGLLQIPPKGMHSYAKELTTRLDFPVNTQRVKQALTALGLTWPEPLAIYAKESQVDQIEMLSFYLAALYKHSGLTVPEPLAHAVPEHPLFEEM